MSVSLESALSAVGDLELGIVSAFAFRLSIIRSALAEALRESTAWSDITAFQRAHGDEYDLIVGLADEESEADGEYLVRLVDVSDGSDAGWFPGASRVECLEVAAGWCRGELGE